MARVFHSYEMSEVTRARTHEDELQSLPTHGTY